MAGVFDYKQIDQAKQNLLNYKPKNGFEAKGFAMGYNQQMANNFSEAAGNRQERLVGIAESQEARTQKDYDQQQYIMHGMSDAAAKGGYPAVIDFLQVADPAKAIEFTNAKLDLDKNMMQTDVMKVQSQTDKAKALVEGYGVLGNMGFALLNAPPEDREGLYKNMLPMVKVVNPNAPDQLNEDAVNMFMLGAAQSSGAAQHYNDTKTVNQWNSKVGKSLADIEHAKQVYGENSDQVKALQQQLAVDQGKMVDAYGNIVSKPQGDPKQVGTWINMSRQLNKDSGYAQSMQYIDTIDQMVSNTDPSAQGLYDRNGAVALMKLALPGEAINVDDRASLGQAMGKIDAFKGYVNQWMSTGIMSADFRQAIVKYAHEKRDSMTKTYREQLAQLKNSAASFGYNPDDVTIDYSTQYEQNITNYNNSHNLTPRDVINQMLPKLDYNKDLQAKVSDMLAKGLSPEKTLEVLNNYLQNDVQWQQQGQTQANQNNAAQFSIIDQLNAKNAQLKDQNGGS